MRRWAFAFAVLAVLGAATARAQVTPEIRPFVGALIPTGDQRDVIKDALVVGGQAGIEVAERLHLLGTFAWTPTEGKGFTSHNGLNLYQYDVGAELFNSTMFPNNWVFRPFVGAGLGARTYHFRSLDFDAKTYFAGYGALGAEFQMTRLALRLEARDYMSRFKGLTGNDKGSTRNDIAMSLGLGYHLK